MAVVRAAMDHSVRAAVRGHVKVRSAVGTSHWSVRSAMWPAVRATMRCRRCGSVDSCDCQSGDGNHRERINRRYCRDRQRASEVTS